MTLATEINDVVMTADEAAELIAAKHDLFPHNTADGTGLTIERVFSTEGIHPYDQVEWQRRDVVLTNWRDGTENFRQMDVEFPESWSVNAANIVTSKYFRGRLNGAGYREWSLRQVIDRVVTMYQLAGVANGYFATEQDGEIFAHELTYMLLHQMFAFNSPVWFNIGTVAPQQVSACFILAVDDTLPSILNWVEEEGMIFKGGSGAGVNLGQIRSSKELMSAGGWASGPVSFMRGADASAGMIKSGGSTRRAAKMVVLDVDHPDIAAFVDSKRREEEKIRVLRDAGFDMDLDGRDWTSVQYQNANNSVRVTDEFMRAVEADGEFALTSRTPDAETGELHVIETIKARALFRDICQAAWECADPGLQYDGVIQHWHTTPNAGRISASNPCSEYMHLDNSSCNLASLRLTQFEQADGTFDGRRFVKAVELVITAMDISICFADFPTPAITGTTWRFRQLGIGYADLGALLMRRGYAYDSPEGRALAAAITSLMTAASYRRSAELAGVVGAYDGYAANAADHKRVMRQHREANTQLVDKSGDAPAVARLAADEWDVGIAAGEQHGWRNAQASLLAPTGTIGLMMDCDTTGVEPDLALVKFKKLVGGGSMTIVNQGVPQALRSLGYDDVVSKAIESYITAHEGNVEGAPGLAIEHYDVFDCSMGERTIAAMGHVRMMAAVQPFLSGAISKTVNMPEPATLEEVWEIYLQAWKMGVKALAIYRDNCKVGQPLSAGKAKAADVAAEIRTLVVDEGGNRLSVVETRDDGTVVVSHKPVRRKLPKHCNSRRYSFTVGDAEGYLHVGLYDDGTVGEIFIRLGKQGSTLSGVMDGFATSTSFGLQHGIPLEFYVAKFANQRFEPSGMTDDPELRMATSLLDYIVRRLALDFLPKEIRAGLGVLSVEERTAEVDAGYGDPVVVVHDLALSAPSREIAPAPVAQPKSGSGNGHLATNAHSTMELVAAKGGRGADAPLCMTCGTKMRPAGSCYLCEGCGSTSGCS